MPRRFGRGVGSVPTVPDPSVEQLRRGVFAVSVLNDVDLLLTDRGVLLTGDPSVEVHWAQCVSAVGAADPESDLGRSLLDRWLRLGRWVATGADPSTVRPLGLPVGHPLHPGQGWAYEHVLGGALDVGLAVVGLDGADPDRVLALPPGVLAGADADLGSWRSAARDYLERMGRLAADRWRSAAATDPFRPLGDCDVVTLLGSRAFRNALATAQGGMCPIAAPMRTRGWTDLRRIDPAFSVAAAAATDERDRGFDRPLLITADEVQVVRPGGRPAHIELRDATPTPGWLRDVLYR